MTATRSGSKARGCSRSVCSTRSIISTACSTSTRPRTSASRETEEEHEIARSRSGRSVLVAHAVFRHERFRGAEPPCHRRKDAALRASSRSPTGRPGAAISSAPTPVKAAALELGLRVYEPRLAQSASRPTLPASVRSLRARVVRQDPAAIAARSARGSARSTCIRRCCRNIAARRRFKPRCATAVRRPACRSC